MAEPTTDDQPAVIFPTVEAKDLNGKKHRLPETLSGEYRLLLIAFEQEQQFDINPWLDVGVELSMEFPDFTYYELPTVPRFIPPMRWWLDSVMRDGIPGEENRARVITLYIDKKPFRETLGLSTEETVYAILIDAQGKVLWKVDGRPDEEKVSTLRTKLTELSANGTRAG